MQKKKKKKKEEREKKRESIWKYVMVKENEDACIYKAKERSVPQTQAQQAV